MSFVDVALTVSDDLASLEGVVSITATTTQRLQRFFVDARDLAITAVTVNGDDTLWKVVGPELEVTLDDPIPSGEEFILRVDYSASPEPYKPGGIDFPMGWDATVGQRVLTHGFPGAWATWMPANEAKNELTQFVLSIDGPDDLVATASGVLTEDGDIRRWDTHQEITHLTLAIGDYEESRILWKGLPIDFALSPQSPKRDLWEIEVPEILNYYVYLFGRFPYDRLGISSINGKSFAFSGPMQVLIPEELGSDVLAHELAHQWVGNSAGGDLGRDNWLFEGLATYAVLLLEAHRSGTSDIDQSRIQVPSETRALDAADSIDDLVDPVTYQRGALFFHALRLQIGDNAFFATIRDFAQRNAHTLNANANNLREIAEERTGSDLDEFFAAWVSREAVPDLPTSDGRPSAVTDKSPRLVAQFDLDGDATESINNQVFHPGAVGGVVSTVDRFGNADGAMLFNGADSYIEALEWPSSGRNPLDTQTISITAWIKPDNETQHEEWRDIVSFSNRGHVFGLGPEGELVGGNQGSWTCGFKTTSKLVDNAWHHVAMTRDSHRSISFFVDGELQPTGTLKGDEYAESGLCDEPAWFNGLIWIGADPGYEEFFKGAIDDLRIYNYALTPDEITAQAQEGSDN